MTCIDLNGRRCDRALPASSLCPVLDRYCLLLAHCIMPAHYLVNIRRSTCAIKAISAQQQKRDEFPYCSSRFDASCQIRSAYLRLAPEQHAADLSQPQTVLGRPDALCAGPLQGPRPRQHLPQTPPLPLRMHARRQHACAESLHPLRMRANMCSHKVSASLPCTLQKAPGVQQIIFVPMASGRCMHLLACAALPPRQHLPRPLPGAAPLAQARPLGTCPQGLDTASPQHSAALGAPPARGQKATMLPVFNRLQRHEVYHLASTLPNRVT